MNREYNILVYTLNYKYYILTVQQSLLRQRLSLTTQTYIRYKSNKPTINNILSQIN